MNIKNLIYLNVSLILFGTLMSIVFLISDDLKIATVALFSIFVGVMISMITKNFIELENNNKLQKVIDEFLKEKEIKADDSQKIDTK